MSAIEWVYQNAKHTGNVYQVLRTIAEVYGEKGACLSMKDIADRTRISKTTARRAVDALVKDGTIKVVKNGGERRKNGATNCYRIPGFDTSTTRDTSSVSGTSSTQAALVPPGDTSTKSEPYAQAHDERAADAGKDKELLKESEKEIKEFDVISQTNSLKSLDTSAPAPNSDLPAQTQQEIKSDFEAKPPDVRTSALEAMARRGIPTAGLTSNPEPPVPLPPLPQTVLEDYFKKFAFDATDYEKGVMQQLIKAHGVEFLRDKIAVAKLTDGDYKRIENPARYIQLSLEREAAKPKPAQTGYVPGQYDEFFNRDDSEPVADDAPQPQFQPPPIDPEWQSVIWLVRDHTTPQHAYALQRCDFGGVIDGVVHVYVPDPSTLTDCQVRLNFRGYFVKMCQRVWKDVNSVRFTLKGEIPDAHPAPG